MDTYIYIYIPSNLSSNSLKLEQRSARKAKKKKNRLKTKHKANGETHEDPWKLYVVNFNVRRRHQKLLKSRGE